MCFRGLSFVGNQVRLREWEPGLDQLFVRSSGTGEGPCFELLVVGGRGAPCEKRRRSETAQHSREGREEGSPNRAWSGPGTLFCYRLLAEAKKVIRSWVLLRLALFHPVQDGRQFVGKSSWIDCTGAPGIDRDQKL